LQDYKQDEMQKLTSGFLRILLETVHQTNMMSGKYIVMKIFGAWLASANLMSLVLKYFC